MGHVGEAERDARQLCVMSCMNAGRHCEVMNCRVWKALPFDQWMGYTVIRYLSKSSKLENPSERKVSGESHLRLQFVSKVRVIGGSEFSGHKHPIDM